MMENKNLKENRVEGIDPITPEEKRRARNIRIGTIILIGAVILAYFVFAPFKNFINESIMVLKDLDIDGVIEYIRGYGAYAALISAGLMILSSIIAPIPAFLITLSNAAIFGWWKGALLSWSSSMVGAAVCFLISRILGREIAVKFTGDGPLKSVDDFLKKYGVFAILVFRLLPFVSFDLVSYAAGLTPISFLGFFIATGIGQAPATIVYSYAGSNLAGGPKKMFTGLLILFALSIIIAVGKKVVDERAKRKNINIVKEEANEKEASSDN